MSNSWSEWFESCAHQLSGGGIWLRGGEINTLEPAEYERRSYRVLIARLSTYRDTAVSTSHLVLYSLVASLHNVYPDLAYLPPPRDGEIMSEAGVPWLLGSASKRGPGGFDCIGLSLSVPQEALNLVSMLSRSSIPLVRSQRLDMPEVPLILCGGASVGAVTALRQSESPVDGIFVGDDNEQITRLFEICRDSRNEGLSKRETLERLTEVRGFIDPVAGDSAAPKANGGACRMEPPAQYMPVSFEAARSRSVTAALTDGCRWKCSFCYESWMHRPYADRPVEQIIDRARELKRWCGADQVDLFSFNYDMHPQIRKLLIECSRLFETVGLKSQRFDRLGEQPDMLDFMHATGKASITCGMEGISDRIRRYLNKQLDESMLRNAFARICIAKVRQIKVFLIATGHENESDLEQFKEFLDWLNKERARTDRGARVVFSVTPLVRFPGTPLGCGAPVEPAVMREAIRQIGMAAKLAGFEMRSAATVYEYALCQMLCSSSATLQQRETLWQSVAETVLEVGGDGVYYESVLPAITSGVASRLEKHELSFGTLTAAPDTTDQTVSGLNRLNERYERFLLPETAVQPVSVPSNRLPAQEVKVSSLKKAIERGRSDREAVLFGVDLHPCCAGLYRNYVATALARALMVAQDELTAGYRTQGGWHWSPQGGPSPVVGHDIVTLFFSQAGAQLIRESWQGDSDFRSGLNTHFARWGTVSSLDPAAPSSALLHFESPGRINESAYFDKYHLKHTRMRQTDGWYRFDFSPQVRKKGFFESYRSTDCESGSVVECEPGPRFELAEFLSLSLDETTRPRCHVRSVIWR